METSSCKEKYIVFTDYLGENVINLLKPKVAQNVANSLGYFIISKNHSELSKVAQGVKNRLIWSPPQFGHIIKNEEEKNY